MANGNQNVKTLEKFADFVFNFKDSQKNMNEPRNLNKEIVAPYTHLRQVKGKQFREKIVLAFNYWLKVPYEEAQRAVEIMTILHNATLMIDDIQDDSVVRRGMPAAHCIFGLPLTINASLQMAMVALQKALQLMPNVLGGYIYTEQFMDVIKGQGVDIYYRENSVCPSESEYKEFVEQKTAGMLLLGIRLLQLFSKNKTNYEEYAKLIGYYYQLRDDYCNLKQQEALEDWPEENNLEVSKDSNFCEDITEGKFSLPIIHAMGTAQGPKILSILQQRTRDVGLKKQCLSLLEKSGSLQYTRDALSTCNSNARDELARLGGNPLMEALLDGLLIWKD